MSGLELVLVVGLVCVAMEGFFSGSEIAMVSADRSRLRQLAAGGHRGAAMADRLLDKPQLLLATTLIGTNLAAVTFSVTFTLTMVGGGVSGELLAIALVTPMTLMLGEVIPKTLFQQHADRLVPTVAVPLRIASVVLRPAVWVTAGFASTVTRVLGTDRSRALITRDELALLLETEATDSDVTDDEREMIQNVLELSEATVGDVMVPLSEVTALPEDATLAEAAHELSDKQHSRMPIYRSRVDDIVGVLHVFDLLQAGASQMTDAVSEVSRAAVYVPENKPAAQLLVELQGTGDHLAVVVDEYGGATGVVTLEDLLEEVVGEIDDEFDAEPSPIQVERPGVWRVKGRASIDRVSEVLGITLPESDDYETIAGLLLESLKRIPEAGDEITVAGHHIRVSSATDRAVEEVTITRPRKTR
ncbi:MAG TPA: hemolysin family protein [Kofleriaceae bacterium]|nr:hemolysin family protein [Kofleriaceae bacterium]